MVSVQKNSLFPSRNDCSMQTLRAVFEMSTNQSIPNSPGLHSESDSFARSSQNVLVELTNERVNANDPKPSSSLDSDELLLAPDTGPAALDGDDERTDDDTKPEVCGRRRRRSSGKKSFLQSTLNASSSSTSSASPSVSCSAVAMQSLTVSLPAMNGTTATNSMSTPQLKPGMRISKFTSSSYHSSSCSSSLSSNCATSNHSTEAHRLRPISYESEEDDNRTVFSKNNELMSIVSALCSNSRRSNSHDVSTDSPANSPPLRTLPESLSLKSSDESDASSSLSNSNHSSLRNTFNALNTISEATYGTSGADKANRSNINSISAQLKNKLTLNAESASSIPTIASAPMSILNKNQLPNLTSTSFLTSSNTSTLINNTVGSKRTQRPTSTSLTINHNNRFASFNGPFRQRSCSCCGCCASSDQSGSESTLAQHRYSSLCLHSRHRSPDSSCCTTRVDQLMSVSSSMSCSHAVNRTGSLPWLFPNMSREEACTRLGKYACLDGVFLVRTSQRNSGGYVLSFVHDNQVAHVCISQHEYDQSTCLSLDNGQTKFYDIQQLIEFHQLNNGGLPTKLRYFLDI